MITHRISKEKTLALIRALEESLKDWSGEELNVLSVSDSGVYLNHSIVYYEGLSKRGTATTNQLF